MSTVTTITHPDGTTICVNTSGGAGAAPAPGSLCFVSQGFPNPLTKDAPEKSPSCLHTYALAADGALAKLATTTLAPNGGAMPMWVETSPDGKTLYSVCMTGEGDNGSLLSFRVTPSGVLHALGKVSTAGGGPCHFQVSADGRWVLAVTYEGGAVCCYPVTSCGALGAAVCTVSIKASHKGAHEGEEGHRQDTVHPHMVTFDPAGKFAHVVDLGMNAVVSYTFNGASGKLSPVGAPLAMHDGAGPRHLVFGDGARFAYVVNELDNTICVLSYDASSGALAVVGEPVSSVPPFAEGTLPPFDFYTAPSHASEILIAPDGRFVYVTNRGHDSVAVFGVDSASGALSLVQHAPSGGALPWSATLARGGALLLVQNQFGVSGGGKGQPSGEGKVSAFVRDAASGTLSPASVTAPTHPHAMCVAASKAFSA